MSETEQNLHAELASLSADLREFLEWERASGATYIEADRPVQSQPAVQSVPASPAPRPSLKPQSRRQAERQASSPAPAQQAPAGEGVVGEDLKAIRKELGVCQRCDLSGQRQNIVFGVGPERADVVVIGEAPGHHEDVTGEPFVGRAGKLLNRMLEAIGLNRDTVYISNVIKCRPPENRDPAPSEIATCSPFLHRQIRALDPKVIVTVGRFAGQNIVGSDASMGELRQEVRSLHGIPVVPTYHPADLLRNPGMKRAAWDDLCKVRDLLKG